MNDNNEGNNKKKNYTGHLIFVLAVLFGIPYIINGIFLRWNIQTAEDLNNAAWLAFWSSYLGALIGCVPALLALNQSKKQAKQQHEEVQLQLAASQDQIRSQREEAEKDRRLSVLPLLDCCISIHHNSPTTLATDFDRFAIRDDGVIYHPDYSEAAILNHQPYSNQITFRNFGLGPALQVELFFNGSHVSLLHLEDKGISHTYRLYASADFFRNYCQNPHMEFEFQFKDIFGNQYSQKQTFEYHFTKNKLGEYINFNTVFVNQPTLITGN